MKREFVKFFIYGFRKKVHFFYKAFKIKESLQSAARERGGIRTLTSGVGSRGGERSLLPQERFLL